MRDILQGKLVTKLPAVTVPRVNPVRLGEGKALGSEMFVLMLLGDKLCGVFLRSGGIFSLGGLYQIHARSQ
jgi:hypothetical protein